MFVKTYVFEISSVQSGSKYCFQRFVFVVVIHQKANHDNKKSCEERQAQSDIISVTKVPVYFIPEMCCETLQETKQKRQVLE